MPSRSWLNPLSLVIGALFVATSAYLSAVFLVSDARRAGTADLERYFTARALGAALVAGVLAVAGIVALHADAPLRLRRAHQRRAAARDRVRAVRRRRARAAPPRRRRGARPLAVGAVVAVVWGWGVAQHPYLLPQVLTIDDAAAPSATLTAC